MNHASLRNQYKKHQELKKAKSVGETDTKVDMSVTIVDLDEINAVDGDFRVKFKIHAIYKFDMKQKKEAVRYHLQVFIPLTCCQ